VKLAAVWRPPFGRCRSETILPGRDCSAFYRRLQFYEERNEDKSDYRNRGNSWNSLVSCLASHGLPQVVVIFHLLNRTNGRACIFEKNQLEAETQAQV